MTISIEAVANIFFGEKLFTKGMLKFYPKKINKFWNGPIIFNYWVVILDFAINLKYDA